MTDQAILKQIHKEMADAVQGIAAKYNVQIYQAGGSIGAGVTTLKFKVQALTESGVPIMEPMSETARHLLVMDINHPAVTMDNVDGFKFTDRTGKEMTIVGYNSQAPKNSVKLQDKAGKTYRAPGGYVRQNLPYQRQTT